MAFNKLFASMLVVVALQQMMMPAGAASAGGGMLDSARQCPSECARRCSKADHHRETCVFLCEKCCRKCLCVPPGYYGNKEVCPCYNNWKTKEGGPKCP